MIGEKRGMELAVSTLILIIIGVIVLIAIVYAVKMGFEKWKNDSDSQMLGADIKLLKQNCESACSAGNIKDYCCLNVSAGKGKSLNCMSREVDLECSIDCEIYRC